MKVREYSWTAKVGGGDVCRFWVYTYSYIYIHRVQLAEETCADIGCIRMRRSTYTVYTHTHTTATTTTLAMVGEDVLYARAEELV